MTSTGSHSENSNQFMRWLSRPNHKCDGKYYVKKVLLLVNWFKFTKKIDERNYYEYDVKMHKVKTFNDRSGKFQTKKTEIALPDRSTFFWRHLRHEAKKNPFDIHEYVFDGKETVYSVNRHDSKIISSMVDPKKSNITYFMELSFRNEFRLYFSREDPSRDEEADRSYKFLKVVMTQKVRYSPDIDEKVQIEFAKNFVYEGNTILRVPESFHDPDRFDHALEIAPRIEAWFGIYIGVRELYEGEPVLNFGISEKLFLNAPKMSLLDYLLLLIDPDSRNDEIRSERKRRLKDGKLTVNAAIRNKIDQYLANMKLKCSEVWDDSVRRMAERHLTYIELGAKNAFEEMVESKTGSGRDRRIIHVPLFNIYEKNSRHIEFPMLPLVKVKSGSKTYSVPMEHLEMHEKPQRFKGWIDFAMQEKFIQAATRKPHIYKSQTIELLENMKFSSEEMNFIQKFELSPDLKMITCPGKVLNEPKLVNRNNEEVKMTPVIRGFKEKTLNVVPEKELCCALFIIRGDEDRNPCIEENDAYEFYNSLIDGCQFRAIRIGKHENPRARSILYDPSENRYGFYPDVTLYNGARNFEAAANDAKTMFDDLPDKEKKILIFIIISDPKLDAYGFIKHYCDVTLGVASQHIRVRTVQKALDELKQEKPSKKIFYNIALKINAKLGGVNQELEYSVSAETTPEEKERRKKMALTMYVGIDVTHPTSGSGIDYSIASIVASINPGGTVYRNKIVVQQEWTPGDVPTGREKTDILEDKFVHLMREFAENNNNRIPDHIVIYRDGVSDSEMLRVSFDELRSLKSEVRRFLEERGASENEPKYTYIIVQKRHKTRIFRKIDKERPVKPEEAKQWDEDMKESDKNGIVNPSSGTTVDKVIVSKYKFDFFLVSHHGDLGTSRPGHYTVMYDDMNLTQDQIYKMTYELAFLSARCRKPVSLPVPVNYAHLSCEKAKEVYKSFKQHTIGEFGMKPSRKEIEKHLQTNTHYPGMSFT